MGPEQQRDHLNLFSSALQGAVTLWLCQPQLASLFIFNRNLYSKQCCVAVSSCSFDDKHLSWCVLCKTLSPLKLQGCFCEPWPPWTGGQAKIEFPLLKINYVLSSGHLSIYPCTPAPESKCLTSQSCDSNTISKRHSDMISCCSDQMSEWWRNVN